MKKTTSTSIVRPATRHTLAETPGKGTVAMSEREKAVHKLVTVDKMIDRQVAEELGVSAVTVHNIRKKLALPPNRISATETRQPKLVYNEDKHLIERRFGVKYMNRGMHHRPMIFTLPGKNLIPSFYDAITNSYIFIVSRQSWHQIKDQFSKVAMIFRANNFILINSKTLEEFSPNAKEVGFLLDVLHNNYVLFASTASIREVKEYPEQQRKAS